MQDASRFSSLTLLESVDLLSDRLTQAGFDKLMLRLSMDSHVPPGPGLSVHNKANKLSSFAKENPTHQTASGSNLMDEIVERAAGLGGLNHDSPFVRALARDGFTLTDEGTILKNLPPEADLPGADDELHALLDEFGMDTAKGHLDQAIKNHTRGNWAAANGQLRTFLEGLFDEIFRLLEPKRADDKLSSENRRQLLATREPPFFQESLGEWGQQGKNFTNGVFKRLHGEGSHPGLSDEEDCAFRLHLVLIVARHFLRRAQSYSNIQ